MTTKNIAPASHQQTKFFHNSFQKTHTSDSSLHCPHRYRTVILYWPNNRKYHYQRYASLLHVPATLFARHSSLTALTSIPDFSIPSYTLPHKNESRQLLACPHSGSTYPTRPVCICIFDFQGTHGQIFCPFWIKSFLDLSAQKAHKHSPSAMNGSVKIMCFSGMTRLNFQLIGSVFMYNLK